MFKYFWLTILIVISACSENESKEIDSTNSLLLSNNIIENYTNEEYLTLKEKLKDPTLTELANIWNIKANRINELTKEMVHYTDSCFNEVTENNLTTTKLYLSPLLKNFKTAILQIDPEIWNQFKKEFATLIDSAYYSKFTSVKVKDYYKIKTHNTVCIIENRAVTFCNRNAAHGCRLTYETFSAILGQNSKHFKSGDELVVTAGVGAFSIAAQPKITIDNKLMTITENGYAEFKKAILSNPGKYSMPVKIQYTKPDGTLKESTFEIDYEVSQ